MKITKEGYAVLENDTHLSRWIEESGRLDASVNPQILTLINPGNTVVDVGAALGDHTFAYANRVGPKGKVYAFEPNPLQFECLKYNVSRFPFPNVEVFGLALGADTGSAKIAPDPNVSAGRLVHGSGDIKVVSLDRFLVCSKIHFIKIDVEGDEIAVLDGARNTIIVRQPRLLIEIHPLHLAEMGRSPKDITNFLEDLHYEYRAFPGDSSGTQYDLLAQPNP